MYNEEQIKERIKMYQDELKLMDRKLITAYIIIAIQAVVLILKFVL